MREISLDWRYTIRVPNAELAELIRILNLCKRVPSGSEEKTPYLIISLDEVPGDDTDD